MTQKVSIKNYPQVEINLNPVVPPLKSYKDRTKIDVRYCLVSPFAFVHIYWDSKIYEVVYEIEEPILDKEEERKKEEIILAMRNMVNYETIVEKNQKKMLEYIDKKFKMIALELDIEISYESYKKIYYYLV
jgi:hypothetical protein